MGRYVLKRIGYVIVVALILSFILFAVFSLIPANRAYTDAREEMNKLKHGMTDAERETKFQELYLEYQRYYGTDTDNVPLRYLRWIGIAPNYYGDYKGLLQGNFGYSYEYKADVVDVIKDPLRNTFLINIVVTVIALGISIPLGIKCAVKHNSLMDRWTRVLTMIGHSIPAFIIYILMIWLFCSTLHLLPPSGMKTPGSDFSGWERVKDIFKYFTLPVGCSILLSLAGTTRYVRASMLDALSLDCIKTARAKGLKESVVIYSHAWRNALIPVVSIVIGWFLGLFGGSLMLETTFGINGMGKLLISSIKTADYDVVMLVEMFYIILGLFGNLLTDIAYGIVDPRVRVNK